MLRNKIYLYKNCLQNDILYGIIISKHTKFLLIK